MVDRREPRGSRHAAGQVRLADRGHAGIQIDVLDETASPRSAGKLGAICIKLPLPPGSLPTLWNDDERSAKLPVALPRLLRDRRCRVQGRRRLPLHHGRTDDIINVAGHRLSTGGMEEVLASHPDVAECAVIGMTDDLKGQVPVGFVVLKAGVDRAAPDIENECLQLVRDRIGPVASFRSAMIVPRLPKTRSGKILRAPCADRRRRGLEDAGDHRGPGDSRGNRRRPESEGRSDPKAAQNEWT